MRQKKAILRWSQKHLVVLEVGIFFLFFLPLLLAALAVR